MAKEVRAFGVAPSDGPRALAHGASTGGLFTVLEGAGETTPRHIHRNEDEACYVLEGKYLWTLGNDQFEATSGSFLFLPRGQAHGYTVVEAGKLLGFFVPSGFERYRAEQQALLKELPPGYPKDGDRLLDLARRYGIEWV